MGERPVCVSRPAGWAALGSGTYLAPGSTEQEYLQLGVDSYRAEWAGKEDHAACSHWELYKAHPSLEGWTKALEEFWERSDALFQQGASLAQAPSALLCFSVTLCVS